MTPFAFLPYRRRRITLHIARLWRVAACASRFCSKYSELAPKPSDFADCWTDPRSGETQIGRRLASKARRRDIANDIGAEVFG